MIFDIVLLAQHLAFLTVWVEINMNEYYISCESFDAYF